MKKMLKIHQSNQQICEQIQKRKGEKCIDNHNQPSLSVESDQYVIGCGGNAFKLCTFARLLLY